MIESYLSKNIPNQPPRGNLDLRLATETVFRDDVKKTVSPGVELESVFGQKDSIFDRRNRYDIVHRS
jgi:hypothetical protein